MNRTCFKSFSGLPGVMIGVALFAAAAVAQNTERVSVDSSGAEGNNDSVISQAAISADGQIVAFYSDATNLVANDTNGTFDVFVHDRTTGITERVSVDSSGAEANDYSYVTAISADGHIVAFQSKAWNLVAGDTSGFVDVFVHDRTTGITERISVDSSGAEANDHSYGAAISADGQIVMFGSSASNLVAGDTNGTFDVFVHDRTTGITERVSIDSSGAEANSGSSGAAISADGQIVAFVSWADNLVAGDLNGTLDVFVHDRTTGTTERVSVDSLGAEANDRSEWASISADGLIVAFFSSASNLVAGDTNGVYDVFVHDRTTGITERVSLDSSGVQGNGYSVESEISADGKFVAFTAEASNLVAGDTNGVRDVFVRDRTTGTTKRVSVDSSGAEANDFSYSAAISADGRSVAFNSFASNLVANDTNGVYDVFVREFCSLPASWSNYGAGFPGTNGVPAFTAESNPVLGASLTLDLANSYGQFSAGLLFIGFRKTSIRSAWGGDLLVVPFITMAIGLPASGTSFTDTLPNDEALCGFEIDLQAFELDPGAAKGVSFTRGLELLLGH